MSFKRARKPASVARLLQNSRVAFLGEDLDPVLLAQRRLSRKRTASLVGIRQLARFYLGGLDVGLVEGIDADDGSHDRGCHLPAEEFLADLIVVGDQNPDARRA